MHIIAVARDVALLILRASPLWLVVSLLISGGCK
jgi:hypothetical protein